MHRRKKFDQELHDRYDKIAREKARKFLSTQGIIAFENSDKYGVDLICHRCSGPPVGYCECEVKLTWKGYEWPGYFDSVQWPAGKKKFAKLEHGPTLFFMVNALYNRALYTTGEQLIASPVVEVSNKYEKKGELFYQVLLSEVTFIDV